MGKSLPNRTSKFKPLPTARCLYANRKIRSHDNANREPKTACFDYGFLNLISEIKNNLGIDNGIVPKIYGYNMQTHVDIQQLWAHALAIYGSSNVALT